MFVQYAIARTASDRVEIGRREIQSRKRVCRLVRDQYFAAGLEEIRQPLHQSLRMGQPQAAASNSRPDGHQPIRAIDARVTFSVMRDEE